MNFKEAVEQIWESLQCITVATLTSLSKGEGQYDLWYDSCSEVFRIGSYSVDFEDQFISAEEALEWYSENIDSDFAINIKEL